MIGPRHYLEDKPTHQSVKLAGRFINLTRLAEDHHLDPSYISRIISGERVPKIRYARKLADALGMTLEDFVNACDERHIEIIKLARRRLSSA